MFNKGYRSVIPVLTIFLLLSGHLFAQQSVTTIQEEIAQGEYYLRHQPDSSRYFLELALKNAKSANEDSLVARIYRITGDLNYESGDYQNCDSLYSLSESYYKKSINARGIALLEMSRGRQQIKLSAFDKGVSHLLNARKIFSSVNDTIKLDEIEHMIAIMYLEKNDFKKALPIFNKLLKKYPIDEDDRFDLSSTFGFIKYYEYDFDSAVIYFKKALLYSEKQKNMDGVAVTWNNMGQTYLAAKKYDDALQCFEKSLEIYRSINSKHGEAFALRSLGMGLYRSGKINESVTAFKKSLDLSSAIGLKQFAVGSAEYLSNIYREKGDYKNAYEMQSIARAYDDSIHNESTEKAIEELQTKYNFEKKEHEVQLLTQENELKSVKLKSNEEEKSRRKYVLNLMIIIVVLVVAALLLVAFAYNNNRKKNALLQIKNLEIAQQHKEIKDSIAYAKKIQEAILPPDDFIRKLFPESFVFYLPKDIVSGDFYWCEENEEYKYMAAVDCTGHGVPGAFMSIVAYNGLSQAVNVNQLKHPNEILDFLNEHFQHFLRQNDQYASIRDGMDISLIAVNKKTQQIEFSGANNPLIHIRKNEVSEIAADKQPVGNYSGVERKPFSLHTFSLEPGDMLYLFSDGFADQFGGDPSSRTGGKKFKYSRFKSLLQSLVKNPVNQQQSALSATFENWRGNFEQLDDVCVIGIKF